MEKIPDNIVNFLTDNRVAAISFNTEQNHPYCVNCFYGFDPQHRLFVFKSSQGTYHDQYVKTINHVAGSVLPEQMNLLQLKGIQFTGATLSPGEVEGLQLSSFYHKKFPVGRAMSGYIWAIRPDFIKFTDNSLGFGNKTSWSALALQV